MASAPSSDVSKYVGAETCKTCHEEIYNAWEKTPHWNSFLPTTDGEDHFVVKEYTGLLGLWARPTHALRLNFDLEHSNYDNVIVRMAPRKESRYRFQTTYTPRPWAVLGGSINILQDANADALTNYLGHNQNYGLTASLTLAKDLAWIWRTTTTT